MSKSSSNDFRDTLYTIDKSGHRKWVYSNLIKGNWFNKRVIVAYVLMAIYLIMPWIEINDLQGVWLDFSSRRFIFFGTVFWATDTKFVVFTLAGLAISLFFFSALFGRVWCGWACPETVFLEFLFRPIERLIEGNGAQRLKLDQASWTTSKIAKKLAKHLICASAAWIIANTALAYIVGKEPLLRMMTDYPWNNPVPFTVSVILMGLMAFQFGWFREQFCTIVCPYARFQSVLLDSHSLVVAYDAKRGEPRGKVNKNDKSDIHGDCVDCGLCVRVCPTGIDIRNGIQLECIHCTACIDACDSVMMNLGRKPGLIRYETEAGLQGHAKQYVRPRIVTYAIILLVIFAAFMYSLKVRSLTELRIVRGASDKAFTLLPNGQVSNHLHAKVSNKSNNEQSYHFSVADSSINLVTPLSPFIVAPESIATAPLFFSFAGELLVNGKKAVTVEIADQNGVKLQQEVTLLGPTNND